MVRFRQLETGQRRAGVNIAGILAGTRWATKEDNIGTLDCPQHCRETYLLIYSDSSVCVVVVCAHWDTVAASPGVDDNGSGVAALLEAARLVAGARGREIRNTVIFAALDKEEVGCEGSRAFIRDFIVPVVVTQFGATVQVIDLPLQIKYF